MRSLAIWLILGCACTSTEAKYTTRLLRCVDKSETLAESRACRALVDAEFGVDGGVR